MGRFIGITGTPGTGKETLAPLVARILGLPSVGLNELVTSREIARSSGLVDPARLRSRLMGRTKGRCLVFGHLFSDVLLPADVGRVVVLRCDPATLRRRLQSRGYSAAKVMSNVEAELIGLISAASVSRYGPGRVAEFDTTSESVSSSAKQVARLLSAQRPGGRRLDWVEVYSSAEKLRSLLSVARTESAFT